jgi:hypothetical protein
MQEITKVYIQLSSITHVFMNERMALSNQDIEEGESR